MNGAPTGKFSEGAVHAALCNAPSRSWGRGRKVRVSGEIDETAVVVYSKENGDAKRMSDRLRGQVYKPPSKVVSLGRFFYALKCS